LCFGFEQIVIVEKKITYLKDIFLNIGSRALEHIKAVVTVLKQWNCDF